MSADRDIAYASATALIELYRKRALSPVEVTRSLLDRLDALQPKINAFCVVDRDGALAAARQSEERWQRGEAAGRLDGVPVTIKDLMLMRGFPTLRGSRLVDPDQDWSEDAPAVARLREAGAIILGKTTTPEFGWKALGDSPLTGITRNPWDLSRTPGGSSAGAAAACAAGIGALHLGSDGAGSIRIPAAFSGIFGLKPSFGRVPAYPLSAMGLLAHLGPMARTVGRCSADADGPVRLPTIATRTLCRPKTRIGAMGSRMACAAGGSPTARRSATQRSTQRSPTQSPRRCGSSRRSGRSSKRSAQIFPSPREALFTLWAAGAAKLLDAYPPDKRALVDPGLVATAADGERISIVDYLGADLVRTELGQRMAAFHQKYDLLLTPMMPVPALPVGQDLNDPATERHWIDWSPFSYPFNLTRQPAASIPCGLTRAGLPIGLQIVGPLYADARVLRAACAFETTQPERRPPLDA